MCYKIHRYCFGNYVYLFFIYFSFLINVLLNADFKNAICFWQSHLVFELIVTDEECCHNLWTNFERHSFDFFVKQKLINLLPVFVKFG